MSSGIEAGSSFGAPLGCTICVSSWIERYEEIEKDVQNSGTVTSEPEIKQEARKRFMLNVYVPDVRSIVPEKRGDKEIPGEKDYIVTDQGVMVETNDGPVSAEYLFITKRQEKGLEDTGETATIRAALNHIQSSSTAEVYFPVHNQTDGVDQVRFVAHWKREGDRVKAEMIRIKSDGPDSSMDDAHARIASMVQHDFTETRKSERSFVFSKNLHGEDFRLYDVTLPSDGPDRIAPEQRTLPVDAPANSVEAETRIEHRSLAVPYDSDRKDTVHRFQPEPPKSAVRPTRPNEYAYSVLFADALDTGRRVVRDVNVAVTDVTQTIREMTDKRRQSPTQTSVKIPEIRRINAEPLVPVRETNRDADTVRSMPEHLADVRQSHDTDVRAVPPVGDGVRTAVPPGRIEPDGITASAGMNTEKDIASALRVDLAVVEKIRRDAQAERVDIAFASDTNIAIGAALANLDRLAHLPEIPEHRPGHEKVLPVMPKQKTKRERLGKLIPVAVREAPESRKTERKGEQEPSVHAGKPEKTEKSEHARPVIHRATEKSGGKQTRERQRGMAAVKKERKEKKESAVRNKKRVIRITDTETAPTYIRRKKEKLTPTKHSEKHPAIELSLLSGKEGSRLRERPKRLRRTFPAREKERSVSFSTRINRVRKKEGIRLHVKPVERPAGPVYRRSRRSAPTFREQHDIPKRQYRVMEKEPIKEPSRKVLKITGSSEKHKHAYPSGKRWEHSSAYTPLMTRARKHQISEVGKFPETTPKGDIARSRKKSRSADRITRKRREMMPVLTLRSALVFLKIVSVVHDGRLELKEQPLRRLKTSRPVSEEPVHPSRTDSPWILLAIIRYLSAIREQGYVTISNSKYQISNKKNQNGKNTVQSQFSFPGNPSQFPSQGIIFVSGS